MSRANGKVEGEPLRVLVRVEFFGPARRDGLLWGYATVLGEHGRKAKLYVVEPGFGGRRINEGEIRVATLVPRDRGRTLVEPHIWQPTPENVALLCRAADHLAATVDGRLQLSKMVGRLAEGDCPPELEPFQRPDLVARRALRSSNDFVDALVLAVVPSEVVDM